MLEFFLLLFLFAIVVMVTVVAALKIPMKTRQSPYKYVRKQGIMTDAEVVFFKRLQMIVRDRYLVFPQIHLSALAVSKATGNYYRAGFQRINHRSVDYVLADPHTLQAVYAVELDDRTHDTEKGRATDAIKSEVLEQINLPLVRFRNVHKMSDEDIIRTFEVARSQSEQ